MSNLAVFASGTGSLFEAILKQGVPVHLLVADRHCRAIDIVAPRENVPTALIERTDFTESFDRNRYTKRVLDVMRKHDIDVIAMAGFMTVLSVSIFEVYGGRILNSHPSLLPKFKGANAVRNVLRKDVKTTGTTIHIATEELDSGPILAQESVLVRQDDTEESLHERIKEVERELYPKTIKTFMEQFA
jgi:phosphoribosylglycinamide formyltransferase 1